jgi:hypothetical protein
MFYWTQRWRWCLLLHRRRRQNPIDLEPLDELLEPPKPSIELKPLPSSLRYTFPNKDQGSLVIISEKLSQEESLRLLTILERHRSAFGFSLQDLKIISPALCTHRIPTNPDSIPFREPQCRLNNTMREVVKKEVLKLLHTGIIYPVPHRALFKLCWKREAWLLLKIKRMN